MSVGRVRRLTATDPVIRGLLEGDHGVEWPIAERPFFDVACGCNPELRQTPCRVSVQVGLEFLLKAC